MFICILKYGYIQVDMYIYMYIYIYIYHEYKCYIYVNLCIEVNKYIYVYTCINSNDWTSAGAPICMHAFLLIKRSFRYGCI
jgi:hypothetical protein